MKFLALLLVVILLSGLITPVVSQSTDIPMSEKAKVKLSDKTLPEKVSGKSSDISRLERAQLVLSDKTTVQSELQDKEKKFKSLVEKAKKNGKVRVIVEFDVDFIPEGDLKSEKKVKEQRDKIKNSQNSIIQSLKKEDHDLVRKFKYIPFATLNVNEKALKHLDNNPKIKSIHEDKELKLLLSDSIPLIGADNTFSLGFTGAEQTVAILDTGIESSHSFFSGRVVSEACYSVFLDCPNGMIEQIGSGSASPCSHSTCDHGTHVAGIAAGNGASFSGVAKNSNIIAIRVFSDIIDSNFCDPDPTCITTTFTDIASALERVYDLRNSFDISSVNLSIGTTFPTVFTSICDVSYPSTKAAIDQLRSVGIATIAASGNESFVNALSSPACISSAISVGATTKADDIWDTFFITGTGSNTANFLDLLAPGASINSSILGNSFSLNTGTSMAAPHVTGAWAVLKERSPSSSVDDILNNLKNSGILITDTRPSTVSLPNVIKPRIQLDAAIADVTIPEGSGVPGCETTNSCFVPFQFTTNEGEQVIWYNEDSAAHTVTSGTPGGGPDGNFDSSLMLAGESFSAVFPRAGTFDYFDIVHPWQLGQVIVNSVPCAPPGSGDWIITSNCTLSATSTASGNVIIQNNSVLTIPAGLSLDINFVSNFLRIESGSGLLIKVGGFVT